MGEEGITILGNAVFRNNTHLSWLSKQAKGSYLEARYDAVHALSYINGLDIVEKAKTAAFVQEFEKKDTGGLNYVKETGVPNVKNAYVSVFILKALGILDAKTKTNIIKF